MPNTIFDRPDLSAFTRLDDLGLEVTGQRIEADHAVLACRIIGVGGVDAAGAKAFLVAWWSGAWRTSPVGGAPRFCM